MKNRIKTQPAVEPVSLSEMRLQLGISQADDAVRDEVISARITSARRWAEQYTGIGFITQTWTAYDDCFQPFFDLKMDLKTIVSVKYIDTGGVQQTLEAENYLVDAVSSRLYPAYGITWPSTRNQVNAVEIEYTLGFGGAASVPEDIKDAIKFIVGHWENYQSDIEGAVKITTIPYAVEQLLRMYRDFRDLF